MKTKSFRGILADGGIDKIYLAGDEPGDGYRIKRFDLMSTDYGTAGADSHSSVVKVFKIPQTTADELVDFSDSTLMAAATFERFTSVGTLTHSLFFDNEIVNQDIYLTHKDTQTGQSVNYYIELEQVKLTNGEQAITNFVAALNYGE